MKTETEKTFLVYFVLGLLAIALGVLSFLYCESRILMAALRIAVVIIPLSLVVSGAVYMVFYLSELNLDVVPMWQFLQKVLFFVGVMAVTWGLCFFSSDLIQ